MLIGRLSDLRDELVIIHANPGTDHERKFIASKIVLCSHSRYFNRALNGSFVEAETNKIEVHGIETTHLRALLAFCYNKENPSHYDGTIRALAKLWIVADRFIVPVLQNLAIGELCRKLHNEYDTFDVETIFDVYNHTPPTSPLRKLVQCEVACCILIPSATDRSATFSRCFMGLEGFSTDICKIIGDIASTAGTMRITRARVYRQDDFLVEEVLEDNEHDD